MKVAYVIGALPFGGVETLTMDTMVQLATRGDVEAVIVNISGCGLKQADYQAAGLKVVSLAGSMAALKTQRLGTLLKLRSFFREFRPDIIHTMLFPGNYFGRLAALGLNIPVINHIHNTVSDSNASARHRFINKSLSRFTSLYISVSLMVRGYTEKELNRARRPSIVIYNAINPDKLQAPAHDLQAMYGVNGPVVVQIGHMVPIKNFDKTIDAFKLVLAQQPDARLLFLGDGPERAALEAQAAALGDKVIFAGYRADVFSFLKSCALLVMPSEHEGFPMVHLEAMACGLPAVLSANVPSLEVAAGCSLVCDITRQSIAENILRLLNDKELYARLRQEALKVGAGFTIASHCDSLLKVYNMLLNHETFTKVQY